MSSKAKRPLPAPNILLERTSDRFRKWRPGNREERRILRTISSLLQLSLLLSADAILCFVVVVAQAKKKCQREAPVFFPLILRRFDFQWHPWYYLLIHQYALSWWLMESVLGGCILHRFDCNENEYTSTTSEDIMNKIMMKRRSTYRIIILIASTPSRDED